MNTHLTAIDSDSANDVSEATLEKAPAHLRAFVQGAAKPAIRDRLHPYGWTSACVNECCALLQELNQIGDPAASAEDPVAAAYRQIDTFMATDFVRAKALVSLRHPEQATLLFHGLVPCTGVTALVSVVTLVERVGTLANGVGRKGTRKADHAALETMSAAGVGKDLLREMTDAVAIARSVDDLVPAATPPEAAKQEARLALLRKIHALSATWVTVARTVVTSRRELILLGIAKRKVPKASAVVSPPVATPAPAPSPVVTPSPVATPAAPAADDNGPASRAA